MSEKDDVTAAELALGLLEGDERAAAQRRVLSDPEFAAEVEKWRDHFATLFPQVPEAEPPASLEARILAANDPVPAARSKGPGLWRPAAIVASLGLVGLTTMTLVQQPSSTAYEDAAEMSVPSMADEQVTAETETMANADLGTERAIAAAPLIASFTVAGFDQPRVAIYNAASETLTMPGDMPIPAGHSAQLWAELDGKAVALGTFAAVDGGVAASTTRELPAGTVLMISFEPEGQPVTNISGEVVAEGRLTTV
ncbi:anti-sigma factor [Sphingomicrobium sediminis]|uniref:Anti-sigma factor n=1 Tax=Sphingomicrobium sediminis TaxID=2950949 RepID=A0A9X2EH34_9SPHN|nr:hypothetical protein [Sphingomicrobium sediminis]MCM8557420.1 hypothetical protein [Sphingomicrobium sediminis]